MLPVGFPDPSLDLVSDNGVANLFRDGDPDSASIVSAFSEVKDQPPAIGTAAVSLEPQELVSLLDPLRTGKPIQR